jgi:hypothetical protein
MGGLLVKVLSLDWCPRDMAKVPGGDVHLYIGKAKLINRINTEPPWNLH